MIELREVTKSYPDLLALDKVSLTINKEEIVVLIGPSGGGKSTILRCINGLTSIDSGMVLIDGEALAFSDESTLNKQRAKFGFVFQHFNLFPHLTVIDNITLGPIQALQIPKEEAEKQGRELLARVGLADKEKAYPNSLSGGQKQRVAIVRALNMQPEALLFDEPTSALDPEMVKEVLDVIRELALQKLTMVIVTHEMNFAREVADRIVFLDQGKVIEEGSAHQLFTSPKSERLKVFLDKVL